MIKKEEFQPILNCAVLDMVENLCSVICDLHANAAMTSKYYEGVNGEGDYNLLKNVLRQVRDLKDVNKRLNEE